MILYFQYLGVFLSTILFLYLIGEVIFRFLLKSKNDFNIEAIFYKMSIGILIFTLLIAFVSTIFKTILFCSLPIIIYLIFQHKKDNSKNEINYSQIGFILAFAVLIFTIAFISYYDSNGFFSTPHADYVFYARLSKNLVNFGIENTSFDITNSTFEGVSPYHYFELWLNGGLAKLFGQNYLSTLMLITFPLLIFLVWLGLSVLLAVIFKKQDIKIFIIAFLGLFLCGVLLPFYSKIPFFENLSVFSRNVWNYQKLNIIYLIILHFLILWQKENKKLAIATLLFLPIFFVSTAPVIFLSIGLYLVTNFLFFDKNKKFIIELLLLSLLVAFSIIVFYYFFSKEIMVNTPLKKIPFLESLKTRRNIIAGSLIQISVIFLPFAIFIFWLRKDFVTFIKSNNLYLILGFIFVLSLISWAVFYTLTDSVQFFSNISVPLINIIFVILLAFLVMKKVYWQTSIFLLFFCFNFYSTWSEIKPKTSNSTEIFSILKSKTQDKNHLAVSLSNKSDFSSVFSKNTIFAYQAQYLSNLYDDAYVVNLSVHQIPIDSATMYAGMEIKLVQNAPFYKFVEKQKTNKEFQSIEISQIDFIKKMKIDYMIVAKDFEIPNHIKNITKEEFIYQNDKFIFLKQIN